MIEFLPFFLILFVSLFFSELFFRFHFPWVITLLIGGMVVGPYGFDLIEINSTVDFLSQIGLVFLMFLAGLETNLFKHNQHSKFKKIIPIAIVNSVVPFIAGFTITYLLGYPFLASFLVGVIFISSSMAIIIPTLDLAGIIKKDLGKSIVATAVILDITSLILLSIFIQFVDPTTNLPLQIFYLLLVLIMLFLRYAMPKVQWFFKNEAKRHPEDIFQQEIRSVFVLLIGTVITFELLGLHPIIAGFFSGLVLSDSIKSSILRIKIKAIGYGIFVPTFFITVGLKTDLSVFIQDKTLIFGAILFALFAVIIKFFGGYVGSRIIGFNKKESKIVASSLIPQLSTTLAVATIGLNMNLIDAELFAFIIMISVISVWIGPFMLKRYVNKYEDNIL